MSGSNICVSGEKMKMPYTPFHVLFQYRDKYAYCKMDESRYASTYITEQKTYEEYQEIFIETV